MFRYPDINEPPISPQDIEYYFIQKENVWPSEKITEPLTKMLLEIIDIVSDHPVLDKLTSKSSIDAINCQRYAQFLHLLTNILFYKSILLAHSHKDYEQNELLQYTANISSKY